MPWLSQHVFTTPCRSQNGLFHAARSRTENFSRDFTVGFMDLSCTRPSLYETSFHEKISCTFQTFFEFWGNLFDPSPQKIKFCNAVGCNFFDSPALKRVVRICLNPTSVLERVGGFFFDPTSTLEHVGGIGLTPTSAAFQNFIF